MTTKDTTGDQLVASIRKSKSTAAAAKTKSRPAKPRKPAKPKAKRSTVPKKKETPKTDNYSVGRRVWPD